MKAKEILMRFVPLVVMLAVLAAFLLPGKLEDRKAEAFGEPLFSHALPEGAALIQKDAGKNDDGSTMAALLLQTDLTPAELETFYGDLDVAPANEDEAVTLSASALNESSLAALKQASLYEDGAAYCFVYLISEPANVPQMDD